MSVITDWTAGKAAAFTSKTLTFEHDLHSRPMFDDDGNPSDALLTCCVTGIEFERPDMIASAVPSPDGEVQYISSLALSCDKTGEHVLPAQ